MTEVIKSHHPESSKRAADILNKGGVIVYPTETLYGIGAGALSGNSVEKVFEVKGRLRGMPIPILVRDKSMLAAIAELNDTASTLAEHFWPGALTLILHDKGKLPGLITAGTGKVAVRISAHDFVKALFEFVDQPITSTSANVSGGDNLVHFTDIHEAFKGKVDLIVDSGNIPPSGGSTIVDVTANPPQILREGDIKEEEIKEFI